MGDAGDVELVADDGDGGALGELVSDVGTHKPDAFHEQHPQRLRTCTHGRVGQVGAGALE